MKFRASGIKQWTERCSYIYLEIVNKLTLNVQRIWG